MRAGRSNDGYAMLAALVVMVLAATFALVVVGAVHNVQLVESADASGWRAAAAEARALAAASRALRWTSSVAGGSVQGSDERVAWGVTWAPTPLAAGQLWPRERAQIETSAGIARHRDDVVLELRAEPWAMGVTCAGDADISARLDVTGSGVYVGGCLRGRENVVFTAGGASATPVAGPVDEVRGDVYPAAAVHGGAGVFAGGSEIHDASVTGACPGDTDQHAGLPVRQGWVDGPSAEFLLAAQAEATPPGQALTGGVLRLDQLPPATGGAAAWGRCILLADVDDVAIEGTPAADAGRLLVLVRGDAAIGRPGETTALSGGLVVTGHLEVRGPLTLEGALHAGSLSVDADVYVSVAPGWRAAPLPGATVPTLVEYGG
jgi:hypothetical protein